MELCERMDKPLMERAPVDSGFYLGFCSALTGFIELLAM